MEEECVCVRLWTIHHDGLTRNLLPLILSFTGFVAATFLLDQKGNLIVANTGFI
jgi:hypothetical protein